MPEPEPPPTEPSAMEWRDSQRTTVDFPIHLRVRRARLPGRLIEVSEGGSGALMTVRAAHPPGAVVNFRIRVDGSSFAFRAQTVRSHFVDGTYQVAVRFVKPLQAPGAAAGEETAAPAANMTEGSQQER